MTEQMKKLEAVKNRCNTTSKVVGVIEVICTIFAVIIGSIALIFIFGANSLNSAIEEGINQGYFNYETFFNAGGVMGIRSLIPDNGNYAFGIGITSLFATLAIVTVIIILAFIRKIFTIIREENSPFSERCLKTIRIGFIVMTAATLLSRSVGATLITGFILFCIYSVFEYGAALQTEIDETL
ncbi:MAG: hypothetical protein J6X94_02950 [Lachnospiraceae bacterium]|nr:hypothetical protein [Lachnospiraceae bacterium]